MNQLPAEPVKAISTYMRGYLEGKIDAYELVKSLVQDSTRKRCVDVLIKQNREQLQEQLEVQNG